MRGSFLLICLLMTAQVFAQKRSAVRFELVRQGRPMGFEYNNASRAVEAKWNIHYVDANIGTGGAGNETSVNNKKVSDSIAAYYGKDWLTRFKSEIAAELTVQSKIREVIKKEKSYKTIEAREIFIVLDPVNNKRKKYTAKIVAQQAQGDKRPFLILQTYLYKVRYKCVKLTSDEIQPLDFEYTVNGIK